MAICLTVGLACASAAEMAFLFTHGADLSRVDYGTDTRAFELLIGASLAFAVTGRPEHRPAVRRALHLAAPIAAVALGVLWVTAGDDSGNPLAWMFRGGMFLAGLLAAVVIAGVAQSDPGHVRPLPLPPSPAVDRDHLLRPLPVALAGLRAHDRRHDRAQRCRSARRSTRRHTRRRDHQLLPRRTSDPAVPVEGLALPLGHGGRRRRHRDRSRVLSATTASAQPPSGPVAHPGSPVKVVAPDAVPNPLPAPILLPAGRIPSAADPLRVMTLGDSVMWDADPALGAALTATGVVQLSGHADPGWGLQNDTHLTADLASAVTEDHPEVVLMMWSWDNGLARRQPAEFKRLLGEAIDTILAPGDGVDGIAFVQFPKVGPLDAIIDPGQRQQVLATDEAGRAAFDAIVSTLPTRYPGRISWLPVAPALEVDGRYSAWLPTVDGGWVRARKTDNTHFCPAGAAVFAAAVTSEIRPMFHLPPPASGWLEGSWTTDQSRYGPADQCPDDQPSN